MSIAVQASTEVEAQLMAMPSAALAAEAAAEQADLEELWRSLDLPGHRVELIDGQIAVSPTAGWRHSAVVDELMDQLFDVKRRQGWRFHGNLTSHIPATRERLIPDLIVAPKDAPAFDDNELMAPGLLLVAEVVSPSSRKRDREVKHQIYARGQVPLYLLIDRLAEPAAVTLFSQPHQGSYHAAETAVAGQPLHLPEPFGIDLDTARLLG